MTANPNTKRGRTGGAARKPRPEKTFCEFFAGVGLVREGLAGSGWKCVYANDIDPHKEQGYRARFTPEAASASSPPPAPRRTLRPLAATLQPLLPPEVAFAESPPPATPQPAAEDHFHRGDVWESAEVLRRIPGRPTLATASFPCIDLSLAGNYQGFQGKHSSTFFAFADVLEQLGSRRPHLVMLENVVGFLSSRGGEDFASAATRLADLGYWLALFVLDAKHFTPQSRPRVFLVGMLDEELLRAERSAAQRRLWPDEAASPASPCADGLHPTPPHSNPPSTASNVLPRPASKAGFAPSYQAKSHLKTGWMRVETPAPPERTMTLESVIDLDDGQEWWEADQVERHYRMMSDLHRGKVDALVAAGETWVGTVFRRKRGDDLRAEVRFDGLAGCLRTPKGGSAKQIVIAVVRGKLKMRWMSPREYARLQGAPDFPLVGPRTRQWWAFADAVCVPAVAWIDTHVLTPLYQRVVQGLGPPHG